jgi:hypothetical protein
MRHRAQGPRHKVKEAAATLSWRDMGAAAILHGIGNHCIIAFLLITTIWLREQLSDEPQV